MRRRTIDPLDSAYLNALRVRLDWHGFSAVFSRHLAELRVSHPRFPGPVIAVGVTGRGCYVLADGAYRRAITPDPHEAAERLVDYFRERSAVAQ